MLMSKIILAAGLAISVYLMRVCNGTSNDFRSRTGKENMISGQIFSYWVFCLFLTYWIVTKIIRVCNEKSKTGRQSYVTHVSE